MKVLRIQILLTLLLSFVTGLYGQVNPAPEWNDYSQKAVTKYQIGKYEDSIDLTMQALEIAKTKHGPESIYAASSINFLGQCYQKLGEYDKAEKNYIESMELLKKISGPDHPNVANACYNLGNLYQLQMDMPAKALEYYKNTVRIYRLYSSTKPQDNADALYNIGCVLIKLDKLRDAEPYLLEAVSIYQQHGVRDMNDYIVALFRLAGLYKAEGEFEKAKPYYADIVRMRKDQHGENHVDYAHAVNNLATVENYLGEYVNAERDFNTALNIYSSKYGTKNKFYIGTINEMAKLYDNLGQYEKSLGLWQQSIDYYLDRIKRFFPSLSEKEKAKFYQTLSSSFEAFNSFAVRHCDKDPKLLGMMYNNLLTTKALLLNATSKVRRRIMNSGDQGLVSMYKSWITLKETLAKLYTYSKAELEAKHIDLRKLETKANSIEKVLSKKSSLFAKEYNKKSYSWEDIRDELQPGEAAVEIVRMRYFEKTWQDSVLYAILVLNPDSQDQPRLITIRNGKELETIHHSSYIKLIKHKLFDPYSYGVFWQPIEKQLSGVNKLYLSLDGVYNKINLMTIQYPDTSFVIDHMNIYLVNNTRDIVENARRQDAGGPQFAELFGSPDYDYSSATEQKQLDSENKQLLKDLGINEQLTDELMKFKVSDLPGTEIEVKTIAEIFQNNNWQLKMHVGKMASKDSVKTSNSPKVLHIATHGYFLSDTDGSNNALGVDGDQAVENPLLRSGLLFTGANATLSGEVKPEDAEDNGILTAYEAMNLDLDNTDLVVLSACETARGKIKNGEGVYGLQRSFQVAGAHTIIMSLWKVDDYATQLLMTEFYKNWIATGDKQEAFRSAQKTIREKFFWPYYWGAFVIVGT